MFVMVEEGVIELGGRAGFSNPTIRQIQLRLKI